MEIINSAKELIFSQKVSKMHIEYWEKNEEDDAEHLVKINVEKEYY